MRAVSHLAKCSVILEHAASTAGNLQLRSCAVFGDSQCHVFPNDWEVRGNKTVKGLV